METGQDFGGAIAQGITGYINGMRTGISDTMDRQAKQQALTIQAQQATQSSELHDSTMAKLTEQVKTLQMQNQDMQNSMSKQTVYSAFDSPTPMTSINTALQNPNISKLFGVGRIADIDQNDIQQVNQAKTIIEAGGHPVQTFSTDPTTNQPVARVVDLNQVKIQTGYSTFAAQRDAELAKYKALTSTSNQANIQATAETGGIIKGIQNPDPVAGAKDALSSYMIAHPEAQAKLEAKGGGSETVLQQMERAFTSEYSAKGINPTTKQVEEFYGSFINKMVMGTGYNAKSQEASDVTNAQTSSQANLNSGNVDTNSLRTKENDIFSKMPASQIAMYKPKLQELSSNRAVVLNVDRILSTADSKANPVSKNVISNAKTWVQSQLGVQSAQAFNNVNFNTQAGMLLTNYIKSLSGLTVSDQERASLTKIILGGNTNDLSYIKQSLQSFRSEIVYNNNILADSVKLVAPYSAYLSTDYRVPEPINHTPSNDVNPPHHTKTLPPLNLDDYKH
ncbi:MAG: hypothetical protein JHC33_01355 [Ignisphaera sp.]|nr:hypothetical protein [Ignisphaera sp.]